MANRWRTLAQWHGRITSDSIADLWSASITSQDPAIPNLPLETPAAGGGVVGTLSVTLDAATLAAAGAVALSGSLATTLGALTLSGTGAVSVAGAATPTLAALTLSGTAGAAVAGSASPTLATMTLASVATVPVAGSGSVTLAALTLTGEGLSGAPGGGEGSGSATYAAYVTWHGHKARHKPKANRMRGRR